ncbi:uncharacterized protein LOC117107049 [Anneissia japonica]|uniref:uncharacterized protein LOC117107049 n=1 Tax=Anneissia japonica TaxID=1529436 RepID=UPI001425BB5A|nr:uncharacterized protein LOC117107049 [Anneissia japonica]
MTFKQESPRITVFLLVIGTESYHIQPDNISTSNSFVNLTADYFKMTTSELKEFLENVDEMVLECTVCLKRLKNPKSLNCLHTFCLACLEDWVKKEKGKLICPTCSKSYPIPEGGLQNLPPNTILNNLIETIEQFLKTEQKKCVCGKGEAKYYCQECRNYLCSTCSDHHKILPVLANHKLHSVKEVRSMSPLQIAALRPPLCSLHSEPLKFFCCICNTAICTDCAITDHSAGEGNHKPISISKEFQTFKETSAALEKAANDCTNKLQDGLKVVIQNATKLKQNTDTSLRDIDNHVQEMCMIMKKKGDQMKNEVKTIYEKKNKVLDVQKDELKTTISDINTKLSFLNQLMKSDEATAMQTGKKVIIALKDRINELPKTEPNDNGYIKFLINKQQLAAFQQFDIGNVTQVMAADCLALKGEESVIQGQKIVAKIIKTKEYEIHANQMKATWTEPTGETNITQVQQDDKRDYFVKVECTSPGVCKLDVSADGEPIKQSPLMIKVEKEGLVNTIEIHKYVTDVVKCEDDCLLVSCWTNEILKYKHSGEYIGKVTLPKEVQVKRMFKMMNGNIAFSDYSKCIKICNMNGQVIKSIGKRVLKDPGGIHVDEATNVVYVTDWHSCCVFMFDIDSGRMIRKIGSPGKLEGQISGAINVTFTNQGNLLVLENGKDRLQLFDKAGKFMKVLVEAGDENGKLKEPRGVVVDEDDNIIISSNHNLQLFRSDGNFIKRIDKPEIGISNLHGLSFISYHPRKVAVANMSVKTIEILNYYLNLVCSRYADLCIAPYMFYNRIYHMTYLTNQNHPGACPWLATITQDHNLFVGNLTELHHIQQFKFIVNLAADFMMAKVSQFLEKKDQICICANGEVQYFCQECREYLCSTCSDHHTRLPVLANHKLHSVEKQPLQIASLPAKCSVHNEALKFFCCTCNIPICTDCAITDHSGGEGNHKPISISKAFQAFEETSAELEKAANDYKNKLHDGLKAVKQSALTLDHSQETTLRDIDNHVQEMLKIIKENGDKLKTKVDTIYKKKKKLLDVQMDDLEAKISDIITKLSYLNQLLKSDEVTAMQSSDSVVTALKDVRIKDLPKIEPDDDRYIKFFINENQMSLLQKYDIGYVSHMRAANCLTLKGGKSVTQGQTIVVNIIKTDECEIYTNQLNAIWTHPTGEIYINQVQVDDNGDYFVTTKCTSPGDCTLDVIADDDVIKQSPMHYFKMGASNSELNFVENVEEKVLECTICFKRLQNPKSLNCLHSFCLACLEDWVKEKGKLTCPTCSKLYPIPDGGLEKLPPNTFINNLLEIIEQFSESEKIKCVCKNGQAKHYCQNCRQYLCCACRGHHEILPVLANHKLCSVEDMRSMTPLQIASLHPPLCSLHNDPLKFFCCICNIPICLHCTITDHNAWEKTHKPINISKAFQTFKETSETFAKVATDCKKKLQDGLTEVTQNATKLEENKDTTLRDIDNHVQKMLKKIKENGDKMKKEVEAIFKKKKNVLDEQIDKLKAAISDINTKLSFLDQLIKSDEATAMQSSEKVITPLKDRINELPKTEPNDNGYNKFFITKQQLLQQCDIGNVTQMREADCLTLNGQTSVTQGQTIVVKVMKTYDCEIHANQLKATWKHPTGRTNITQVEEDDNGDYFLTGKCTSPGVCELGVSVNGKQIKQSPIMIKVEKEGLVNTIQIDNVNVYDVAKGEVDHLLVSCRTNEILKYKESGEYIGKIILPQGVQVYRMYKMKNGNIVFSEILKHITICNENGQVIKSIGLTGPMHPSGIHVDEVSNVVYVGDWKTYYAFMFDIDNDKMIKKIGSQGNPAGQLSAVADVTLTNQGHIILLENDISRLQLFDNEGKFMKILVEAGDEDGKVRNPCAVVVDADDNIIISSDHKLQLFSSDGNFIKRIDNQEDGIKNPWGLSIISYHPRSVAVANYGDNTIKIFNY